MLIGMVLTAIGWALILAVGVGLGAVLLRSLGRGLDSIETTLTAFWLGWAASIGLLQIVHLWAPIDGKVSVSLVGLGLLGLLLVRGDIAHGWRQVRRAYGRSPMRFALIVGIGLLFVLWLANRAMAPITPQGDSGFYHIGAVRWLQAEPLVIGLANVDGRFGFNNSFFLYLAALDGAPGPPHFYHLGSPLLILVFTAQCAWHFAALRRPADAPNGRHLLGALWAASIVPFYFMELGTTSTDTVNMLIGFVVGLHLFRLVFEPLSREDVSLHALAVVLLSSVGVTVKLSFAFYGFFAVLVAGGCFARQRMQASGSSLWAALRGDRAAIVVVTAAAAVIVLVWVARGVAMTGYVAYPSNTLLHFDVDWKVPEAQVVNESDTIKIWARYPFDQGLTKDEVLTGYQWLRPWFVKTAERADVFTIPMLLFLAGAIGYAWRRRVEALDVVQALLFLGPALIAFVLWFATAPAERFAGAVFWLLGAGVFAVLHQQSGSAPLRARLVGLTRGFVMATVAVAAVIGAVLSQQRYGWAVFVSPGPEQGFHPIPTVVVAEHYSDTGVRHVVPLEMGDPTSKWTPDLRCWDAPLPCTKRPKPRLALRDATTRRAGYRLTRTD